MTAAGRYAALLLWLDVRQLRGLPPVAPSLVIRRLYSLDAA